LRKVIGFWLLFFEKYPDSKFGTANELPEAKIIRY